MYTTDEFQVAFTAFYHYLLTKARRKQVEFKAKLGRSERSENKT